jgi:hypothetical protein
MKTIITYILSLLPGVKLANAALNQKQETISQLFSGLHAYLPFANASWAGISHYIFGALKQAFRDSILSDLEMDFLLLSIAGYWLMAKTVLKHYFSLAKSLAPLSSKN